MIRSVFAVLLLGAIAAHQPSGARAGTEAPPKRQAWNFDMDPVGRLPAEWTTASTHPGKSPAVWAVTADATAPSKPNVFTLTRTDNQESTYNLAVLPNTSYRDVELNVRIKSNRGKEDQGGGVVWRYKDPDNYYICRVNPLESNFRVYVVEKGKRRQFSSFKIDTVADQWYAIRIVMVGDEIACFLDGKKLIEARDATFSGPGAIGLWTKADAASSFDDLTAQEVRDRSHLQSGAAAGKSSNHDGDKKEGDQQNGD